VDIDAHRVTTEEQLRSLYAEPTQAAIDESYTKRLW
jgi:hypothetical protein